MINSYNKIYNIGNKAIDGIFNEEIILQEKVDGSQFSFTKVNGELHCRSKGAYLNFVAPEKMFVQACNTVQELGDILHEGWIYRGEYLSKPKHNTLHYSRIPEKHICIFDIDTGDQHYLDPNGIMEECKRIGLEAVPVFYKGKIETYDMFRDIVDKTVSFLGGAKIEGVVAKNYIRFALDGKVMMGKFVSEEFRESHSREWKNTSPNHGDIIQVIGSRYTTNARWNKAIQHLKENGTLTTSLKDIPHLLKEIRRDVEEECSEEIKKELFEWAWPKVCRQLTHGLPEYYKEYLIKESFINKEKEI